MTRYLTSALLSFFTFLGFCSFSQGTLNYSLTVNDPSQKPLSGLDITLIETSSFKRLVYKTDTQGKLSLELKEEDGSQWMLNVGEMYNYSLLNVPPGSISTGSATVSYDVARWKRQNEKTVDRTTITLEDIPQRIESNSYPGAAEEVVEIVLISKGGRAFYNIPVKMTCYALGVSYSTTTDDQGVARFKLPLNENFQVDVDGEDDITFYDTGIKPALNRVTLTYEKINFREELNAEGYLVQEFIEKPRPVSNRVMVLLHVSGGDNGGANEGVYIETDYSSKKYFAKTTDEGWCVFLLPRKKTYHVSFEFQKDASVIDLSHFFGIGYSEQTITYVPDPRLQFPENYLPSAEDVKSYDINNYLTERYPDTPGDELLNVQVKWGSNKINSGSKEALLELGFSVKEPSDKKTVSKPLNIAFVLDKSGSMSGEKIDLLKTAMLQFIEKLRPEDRVSVVFFDDEAVLAYGEEKLDKAYLNDIVRAVQADGGTSIYEGLKMGYANVEKHRLSNSVNRLILLTDGYGSKPVDFILEQSAAYFKKGISVSTIGVGAGYNHSLLELLSKYSGGLAHQAIESEGISMALNEEFESLFYPLASDLKVSVFYNDHVIYKTIYGVPEKSKTDHSVVFELPRVFSSLNKMVLMKFKIENPERDFEKNKIRIEISYFDEVKQEPVSLVKETGLEWTDETDVEMIEDTRLKNVYSIAVINQSLKLIADLCDAKNYAGAKELVHQTLKSIGEITEENYSPELIPIIEDLKLTLTYLDRVIRKG